MLVISKKLFLETCPILVKKINLSYTNNIENPFRVDLVVGLRS